MKLKWMNMNNAFGILKFMLHNDTISVFLSIHYLLYYLVNYVLRYTDKKLGKSKM